jgi:2'-hydroxyisoflavone reductase
MKLLIIGGTRFVGRHLVTAALARNHQVTLFNRGNHPSEVLANVETICGDRNNDLSKLRGRRWDAVIDTCGYLPRSVKAAAEVLSGSVDRYCFISSLSAYADVSAAGVDETAPLAKLTTEQLEAANAIDSSGQTSAVNYGKMYGGLKALCEQAAEEAMSGRVLIIRPGLIVGPYDYTDRFTYWVVRIARGGEVLAPGRPDQPVQFIDARDLSEWIVRMIERHATGVYNANGAPNELTMGRLLQECKKATDSDASFSWVSEDFLLQEKVAPWSDMPLWMPEEAAPHMRGFMLINCDKAIGAGLTFRSLSDTIKETFNWWKTNQVNGVLKAGLDPAKESSVLGQWHERH